MSSWKTTIVLVVLLGLALALAFPRPLRHPTDNQSRRCTSHFAQTEEAASSSSTATRLRPPHVNSQRLLEHLHRQYATIRHEWHDRAVCNILIEHDIWAYSSQMWLQDLTQEKLKSVWEKSTQELFYYLDTTNFTALSEDEKATLAHFRELRERMHELADNDDTPLDDWREFAQEYGPLPKQVVKLIRKQFLYDAETQMTLGEALWIFYPKSFPEAGTGVTGLGKQDGDQEITVFGYLPSNPKLIPPPPVENLEDLLPKE
ncbi:MAG: hypothetical protein II943_09445 [Victivallales bacterium]|nr:hypothetical protein [Victivallales bacterium]MBQ4480850.1 hypothetical protein [Victivallales bacterium]